MSDTIPNSFSLKIPESWTSIPLERNQMRTRIDELVGELDGIEVVANEVVRLKAILGKLVVEADDAGMVFVASYLEVVPPEEIELDSAGDSLNEQVPAGDPVLLAGLVVLATYQAAEISADGGTVTVEGLIEALVTPTTKGSRYLNDPELVTLPAGKAVEIRTLESYRTGQRNGPAQVFALTYHIPLAGGNGLAILAFRTPCLGYVEEFSGLFKLMAESLEFSAGGSVQ